MSAPTVWRLEGHAPHWMPLADLTAVTAWMADNGVEDATAAHPVVVANGMITFERDRCPGNVREADRKTTTVTVALLTEPPDVFQPDLDDATLRDLAEAFRAHEFSSGFDGTCATCSAITVDEKGWVWCRSEDAVLWPCPPVRRAIAKADLPLDPPREGQTGMRLLGDCLSRESNAVAFGSDSRPAISPLSVSTPMALNSREGLPMPSADQLQVAVLPRDHGRRRRC